MQKYCTYKKCYEIFKITVLLITLLVYVSPCVLAESPDTVGSLMEQYAEAMLTIDNEADLAEQLELILDKAIAFRDASGTAESIYLVSRILYGYSTTQGMFTFRSLIKDVRNGLELALRMDQRLLDGAPKGFLGYLYVGLPGWPLSFGDKGKGFPMLEEAMEIDDQNLSNNYFYAYKHILVEDWESAKAQLLKARNLADPNTQLPNFQALIMREINVTLAKVEDKQSGERR